MRYVPSLASSTYRPSIIARYVNVAAEEVISYFRSGNSFEMSAVDMRSSVYKNTGLMRERGVSINADHLDTFVQKHGGAWEVDLSTVPKELQIKFTSGTHFELAPNQAGMTLKHYQNLIKQVQVYPYNI